MSELTRILQSAAEGDAEAAEELLPLVYAELRQLAAAKMAREQPGQTLQPTALVHEAWLRISGNENRAGKIAVIFSAQPRRPCGASSSNGRGGNRCWPKAVMRCAWTNWMQISLLPRQRMNCSRCMKLVELSATDADAATLVKLRYFSGMTMPEAADAMGLPLRSAEGLWTFARAWLRNALKD